MTETCQTARFLQESLGRLMMMFERYDYFLYLR